MSKQGQYEWLIVTAGNSDISVYNNYLKKEGLSFLIKSAGGKEKVLNMNEWNSEIIDTLKNDIFRSTFKGVVLVVDSDNVLSFDIFQRLNNKDISYVDDASVQTTDTQSDFDILCYIKGTTKKPIKAINVPRNDKGCLETDLLEAYRFPTAKQGEYRSLIAIIKKATDEWDIPKNGDGKSWWEENEKAKMDKFIYAALRGGFKANRIETKLPPEPPIVKNIRNAMTS